LLNPLILVLVYVLVFSIYLRIEMDHYAAFLLCGLLPWMWFSSSLIESSRAIIDNAVMVKKMALPSEIFPLVNIGSNLIHFLLSLPVLLALLLLMGINVGWPIVLLPVVLVLQGTMTAGLALACASLAAQFRDLLQIIPNLLMVWFFITPVFYPPSLVPDSLHGLLLCNPMAYMIEVYHQILFYRQMPPLWQFSLLAGFAIILVMAGYMVFDARREMLIEEV
jgi:lipopolysaccharide transport system permease protein